MCAPETDAVAGAQAAAAVGAAAESELTLREGGSAQKGVEGVAEAARQASGLHDDRLRRGLPLRLRGRRSGEVRALGDLQERPVRLRD
jgi:hypothetical protein